MTSNQPQPPSLLLLFNRALIHHQRETASVPLIMRQHEADLSSCPTAPEVGTARIHPFVGSDEQVGSQSLTLTRPIESSRLSSAYGNALPRLPSSGDMVLIKTTTKPKGNSRLQLLLDTLDEIDSILDDDTLLSL